MPKPKITREETDFSTSPHFEGNEAVTAYRDEASPDHTEAFDAADPASLSGEVERLKSRLNRESARRRSLEAELANRLQSEKMLCESEEKYRMILESMQECCFEVDLQGNLTFFNDALSKLSGYSRTELFQLKFTDYTTPQTAGRIQGALRQILKTGEPTPILNYELRKKDGQPYMVEVTLSLLRGENGEPVGFRGLLRDISERIKAEDERRKLEEQLQQARKLKALGTLAGGVAHDFNNLLMAIQGNVSIMLLDIKAGCPHYAELKSIERSIERGASLTRQLLGFARKGKYVVKPTNLNELITKTIDMFGRTRKEITIHCDLESHIWTVEADQGQIEQVLLNLLVNAWQAMPQGGDLFIKSCNLILDEKEVSSMELEPGRYVAVSVRDTGIGMDEGTRGRIFEPFFTTKETGEGSGLGLSSAFGIVKNHGGFIGVESLLGTGSDFTVYLPASRKACRKEIHQEGKLQKGSGTILFVDDEEIILEVGKTMLEELGYTALIARGGREALEAFARHRDHIDLVILDMVMPDLGGGEVFDRLKEMDPAVRVILSSGYSIRSQATKILERGCNGFLQKPYRIDYLSQIIRKVLSQDSAECQFPEPPES